MGHTRRCTRALCSTTQPMFVHQKTVKAFVGKNHTETHTDWFTHATGASLSTPPQPGCLLEPLVAFLTLRSVRCVRHIQIVTYASVALRCMRCVRYIQIVTYASVALRWLRCVRYIQIVTYASVALRWLRCVRYIQIVTYASVALRWLR